MIKETDQSESSLSDDEEIANQSVHFALQQEKQSGDTSLVNKQKIM